MNNPSPNLFNALFQFHPREGHTPQENFLSEAFAHVLATCDTANDAWLSLAMDRPVHAAQSYVTTRESEHDEENVTLFPDMRVKGVLKNGEPFDLSSEHKWGSPCDPSQIKRYLKVLNQGSNRRFVFICATYRQKRGAVDSDPRMKGKVILWEDIFQKFNLIQNKPDILVQFLDFMKTHGLSPAVPIELAAMVGFIKASGFLTSLQHSANKLNDDFDWEFFPKRYLGNKTRNVTDRWGRIAIEFATPDWKPTITVGFLYNERDHGVSFVNRQKGIDLLLRIETGQDEQKNISPALAELRRKQKRLSNLAASALLLHDSGNDNDHSLLIVRSCLGNVIEKAVTQQEQLEAIYGIVKGWGETLFGDGALERAFKEAGLDSGL